MSRKEERKIIVGVIGLNRSLLTSMKKELPIQALVLIYDQAQVR